MLVAGLALALGGGVAGAALVGQPDGAPSASPLQARLTAAEVERVANARAGHALRVAQRARRLARRARSKANESLATSVALLDSVDKALADSANALAAAQQAQNDATNALQAANQTSSRLDWTEMVSNTVAGTGEAPGPAHLRAPLCGLRL